jgi:hypothetical protein
MKRMMRHVRALIEARRSVAHARAEIAFAAWKRGGYADAELFALYLARRAEAMEDMALLRE